MAILVGFGVQPSEWSSRIIDGDRVFRSDSGVVQVQTNSGARWALRFTWNNVTGSSLTTLRGRFTKLQGLRDQMQIDMTTLGYVRQGSGANTPTVSGAHSAGATTIAVDNLTLSTTGLWLDGDFISIGNQLHGVGSDYDSDGAGEGSVEIYPPLHKDLSGGEAIEDSNPIGVFFVTPGTWTYVPHYAERITSLTAELEQDVNA